MSIVKYVIVYVLTVLSTLWVLDNYADLTDRTLPYTRISEQSVNEPVNPSECGKPDGPIPIVIHEGDCVKTTWKVDYHNRRCRVTPYDPYVKRDIVDAGGVHISLPKAKSQFTPGVMETPDIQMSKRFIQPKVSQSGNVKYSADVCYICQLKNGMDNPIDWISPRCVKNGQINYYVQAN